MQSERKPGRDDLWEGSISNSSKSHWEQISVVLFEKLDFAKFFSSTGISCLSNQGAKAFVEEGIAEGYCRKWDWIAHFSSKKTE